MDKIIIIGLIVLFIVCVKMGNFASQNIEQKRMERLSRLAQLKKDNIYRYMDSNKYANSANYRSAVEDSLVEVDEWLNDELNNW